MIVSDWWSLEDHSTRGAVNLNVLKVRHTIANVSTVQVNLTNTCFLSEKEKNNMAEINFMYIKIHI